VLSFLDIVACKVETTAINVNFRAISAEPEYKRQRFLTALCIIRGLLHDWLWFCHGQDKTFFLKKKNLFMASNNLKITRIKKNSLNPYLPFKAS